MEGLSIKPNNRVTRRGIQRLKTGCRTCKARRVKCDEQRPSCRRCTSAGRECMGYGIWGGGGHPGGGPSTQCLALYRPSNTGPVGHLNAEDRRILEWFMLARLQGIFPFPFWEILVPQACYNEPVILSCVLALGCIHKRACISKGSINSQRAVDLLESATLRHYNTAISLLNRSQSDGSRASTRVTLTGCLTFVIIEYLQKRPTQGLLHLQHGLQILQNHKYNNIRQPSNDPVDDWLAEAFDRLDIQAKLLFKNTTDNQPHPNIWANNEHPLTLKSLHEARQQLDFLISEAYGLQRWARNAESSANISLLFQALSVQQRLQRDLRSWLQAYRTWRTTLSSLRLLHSPQELVARRLLLVYHTMASIITATALYPGDESVFDHHNLQFASIITSSKEIVQIYNPATPRDTASYGHCTQHFTFTSDLGLIPVLYYTVLKCRDPQMRRDALSMLATKTRQEGIWEGPTVALIAAEVIRLEETPYIEHGEIYDEGSANEPILSGSPFQPSRISDIIITLPDDLGTDLVLVCKRKLGNGAWGVVERRHNGVHWY